MDDAMKRLLVLRIRPLWVFSLFSAAVVLPYGSVFAADPNHVAQLRETKKCHRCDLTYADLHEADLSGADLTNANLTLANLSGAQLLQADLTQANLFLANLTNANLIQAF